MKISSQSGNIMTLNLSRFELLFTLAPTAWLTALDLCYVNLYCLFFVVFLLALSKTAYPIFAKSSKKMENGLQ